MGSVIHGLRLVTDGLRCVLNGRFESIKDHWVHISTRGWKCRWAVEGFPFMVSAVVLVNLFGVVFGDVADVGLAVVMGLV